jgi:hypothetical protein
MQPQSYQAQPAAVPPWQRCTAPACIYGMIYALIEELGDRCLAKETDAGEQRQLAALNAVAQQLLSVLTTAPAARVPQMFDELRRRYHRAQRCTDRGVPVEKLLTLARPIPPGRFRLDIPSLCWAAVARLREAIEQCVAAGRDPKRLEQLRIVAALENDLRQVIAALHRHEITWDQSAGRTAALFSGADAAIGYELSAIFGEAESLPQLAQARQ